MRRREVWASVERCDRDAKRCDELAEEYGRRAEQTTDKKSWIEYVTSGAECREMAEAFREERDRLFRVALNYQRYKHNQF